MPATVPLSTMTHVLYIVYTRSCYVMFSSLFNTAIGVNMAANKTIQA